MRRVDVCFCMDMEEEFGEGMDEGAAVAALERVRGGWVMSGGVSGASR